MMNILKGGGSGVACLGRNHLPPLYISVNVFTLTTHIVIFLTAENEVISRMNYSDIGQVTHTEKFDPTNGYEKSAERMAMDRFEIAAWEIRKRQIVGALQEEHIHQYEDARATLQEMGWSEDGLDQLEAQYVGMQAHSWKVSVV
jgi:hypothetical protein